MIARNIKQLMLIKKMLEEEKDDREMVSILKIPPFTLPRLKGIAKESDYKNLLNIFEKIYNLNYESKIGNIDAELGLILLITRLN
jgi:DNA polymerase III delta subunit